MNRESQLPLEIAHFALSFQLTEKQEHISVCTLTVQFEHNIMNQSCFHPYTTMAKHIENIKRPGVLITVHSMETEPMQTEAAMWLDPA